MIYSHIHLIGEDETVEDRGWGSVRAQEIRKSGNPYLPEI
jgi:hypothetical protein